MSTTGAIVTVEGMLFMMELEGRHFELELASSPGRRYVLAPAGGEAAAVLEACVGRVVRVSGTLHEGPSIFMRGPVVRVTQAAPVG